MKSFLSRRAIRTALILSVAAVGLSGCHLHGGHGYGYGHGYGHGYGKKHYGHGGGHYRGRGHWRGRGHRRHW